MRASLSWLLVFVCLVVPCAAQDMPLTQVLLPGEGWQLLGEGFKFTEGPAVDADGNVFFTDIPADRIHKIDLQGKITVFATKTAKTNGLMFGPDGRLFGCRNGDKQIVAYKPDGTYDVIAKDVTSNDLVVTSRGEVYFTDPANKRVMYINATGDVVKVADGFRPNGIIAWPGEGTIVVTDSDHPHLWTFRVEADGSLKYQERYYQPLQIPFGGERPGSDGMTVDTANRLYVATHAGIQMFDPTGRLGGTILKPQASFLSNVTFGGPGLSYLYATNGDKVYRRKTKVAGAPYFQRAKKKS